MHQVVFVTGNASKLAQAQYVARAHQLPLEIISAKQLFKDDQLDYEEQGEEPWTVASNGAQLMANQLQVAVMTEDSIFRIPVFGGMPGIRSDLFLRLHGRAGILQLMESFEDQAQRACSLVSSVAFCRPGGQPHCFTHHLPGHMTRDQFLNPKTQAWIGPSAPDAKAGGFNAIFVPDGWDHPLSLATPEQSLIWGYREPVLLSVLQFIAATTGQDE